MDTDDKTQSGTGGNATPKPGPGGPKNEAEPNTGAGNRTPEAGATAPEDKASGGNASGGAGDRAEEGNPSESRQGGGGETVGEWVDHVEEEIDAEVHALNKLQDELKEMRDHALRARAEAENVRKRAEKQIADANKYAAANFARDMLSVSDNLRRALDAVPEEARGQDENLKQLLTGVEMVEKELQGALSKHGVQEVSPNPGDKFDHSLHQAMMEVETAEHPPGSVAMVLQAGYVIHDRLLRAAMVGIAKAPAKPAADNGNDKQPPLDEDDNIDGG